MTAFVQAVWPYIVVIAIVGGGPLLVLWLRSYVKRAAEAQVERKLDEHRNELAKDLERHSRPAARSPRDRLAPASGP